MLKKYLPVKDNAALCCLFCLPVLYGLLLKWNKIKQKRGHETAAEAYKDISWQDTTHFYGPKYNKIWIHYLLVKSGEDIEVILHGTSYISHVIG